MKRLIGVSLFLILSDACTDSSPSPTPIPTPTPTPTPTPVPITITTAPDVLLVGASSTLKAVNSVTQDAVAATWSSGNPGIASIAESQLQAVSAGRVAITATFQGATATASVKVVPNFAGRYPPQPEFWGNAFRIGCVDLTNLQYCRSNFGTELFRLEITQIRDRVFGNVYTSSGSGDSGNTGAVTGEIDDAGNLTLHATLITGQFPFPSQIINSWSTHLDASNAMSGTFSLVYLMRDGTGISEVTYELRGISHGP